MPFMTDGMPGGAPLFAYGRSNTQRAIDIFNGTTRDRLGDDAFADPRETKLIGIVNNILKVNDALGNPLGVPDDFSPNRRGTTKEPGATDTVGPAPADVMIDRAKDP